MENHEKITGILILIVGVVLLIWPGQTMEALISMLGWCMVICGAIEVVIGVVKEKLLFNIIGGFILAVAGVVFITRPDVIITFLPTVIGAACALAGVCFLVRTLMRRNLKNPVSVLTMVGSVAAIIAGIVLIVNAYTTVKLLMVVMGIFLVYFGIMRILKN